MADTEKGEYSLVAREGEDNSEPSKTESKDDETKALKSSMWQSLCNLLSDIEGTGLLALPFVIKEGGVVAIAALAIVPFICCYTGKILIECLYVRDSKGQKVRVRNNYKDMAESCWPRYGGLLVFIPQLIGLLLLASLYLVLCGSLLGGLLPQLSPRIWMAISALIGLPTLFIKHLSHVAWFSLLSLIALTIAVLIILVYGVSTSAHWDLSRIALWDSKGIPIALAVIIFSYIAHAVLPTIEANMREPSKFNLMLSMTYGSVFVIKFLFALIGFLTFSSNIDEVITNSIPIRAIKIVVNSFLLLNVFFSYPFRVITLIHCIEDSIDLESIHARFSGLPWFIFMRVVLNFLTLLPAVLVPHFALMMSFLASLTGMLVAFIFPCLFHLYLQAEYLRWYDKVLDCIVIGFGVLAGGTGLIVSGAAVIRSF